MLGGMQNGTRYGRWADGEQIVGGSMGGPTVLFEASQARAMVLGSFQNFMSGSSVMVRKAAIDFRRQWGQCHPRRVLGSW
jgi:hypothetical protein